MKTLIKKTKTYFKKNWLLFISILIVISSLWPLFRLDFFRMHDWLHVARLIELDTALKAGLFPPRWAPDFGWGYGMPLFHFYPPLPYYLAELLYLIKVPAVWAIKTVFALNFFAGFYFAYLWAKDHWGKLGGLISATAFVYLPYRAVQFYVRGSLAELTAMTFIPLFFYAAKRKNIILTALAITGIFLSHNVVALFALLFIPLYFLFNLKDWKKFTLTSLIAFGLSAFFILPAFFEKSLTSVNKLSAGFSYYGFHFIYLRQLFSRAFAYGGSVLGPKDDISFQLGWPHVLLILPAISLFLKKRSKELFYVFFALAISIFLMTFHSQFIWDKITILHMAQFPWRLLAFSASFIAFLSGSITSFIKNKYFLAGVIFLIIALNFNYFQPKQFNNPADHYYTEREKIKNKLGDILPDYLPKTAVKPDQPANALFDLNQASFTFDSQENQTHSINQFYFPGWQVEVDDQPVEIKPDEKTGLISFNLSEGNHQITAYLGKTRLQQIADMISLITWLSVIAYLGLKLKTKFS
ncbi:hypothetical protein ACFL18_00540 [Patescibacteria group bacterium]